MLCTALFGLGALLTGVAPVVRRGTGGPRAAGLGPALLVPGSLAIVRATFDDPRERAPAIGLWSTSSGVALAVGPVLGGVVVGALGWRWVVLLNVPLCAALMVLAARIVPPAASAPLRRPTSTAPGVLLATAGMAALAFALIERRDRGWASPRSSPRSSVGRCARGTRRLRATPVRSPG